MLPSRSSRLASLLPFACFALLGSAGAAGAVACSSSTDTSSGGDASADGSSSGDGATGDGSSAGDDGGAGDAGGDAAQCALASPYSSKNKACNDCAESKCCVEINGCLTDTVCNDDYVNCLLACALDPGDGGDAGIATCEAACDAQYPTGKSEYDTAIGCADAKCKTECQ